jgi:hypothetical protein
MSWFWYSPGLIDGSAFGGCVVVQILLSMASFADNLIL